MMNPKSYLLLITLIILGCTEKKAVQQNEVEVQEKGVFLKVLGIAQDAGYPQAGCLKNCCRDVWGQEEAYQKVACLGLVDTEANQSWMFDATPDFKDQLQEITNESRTLSGIFLTHAHIGHYTGLIHLGREVIGAKGVPVFTMPRMHKFLTNNGPWSQLVELQNIRLHLLQNDSTLSFNQQIKVTPLSVPHRDEFSETVGYRIEGPERKALFIPDIDKWHLWERSIKEEITKVDWAFLDGTFFKNGEIKGRDMSQIPHPFVEESIALLKTLALEERKKVYFIHFNHTNPLLIEGSAARQQLEELGLNVAEEGRIFPL